MIEILIKYATIYEKDNINMKFPSYFPKGCPPQGAKNIEYEAYRICKNKNILREDFLSYYQLGLAKDSKNIKKYGISLDTNREHLIGLLGLPAQKNRGMKCVAKGITKKNLGVVLLTPSSQYQSHLTWWLKEDADPENYFKCDYIKGE